MLSKFQRIVFVDVVVPVLVLLPKHLVNCLLCIKGEKKIQRISPFIYFIAWR